MTEDKNIANMVEDDNSTASNNNMAENNNLASNSNAYLKQRLIEKESVIKAPILAAILGWFFPPIGFLYVRKPIVAVIALLLGIMILLIAAAGIGVPFLLLYAIVCAFMCYKAADQINIQQLRAALEKE